MLVVAVFVPVPMRCAVPWVLGVVVYRDEKNERNQCCPQIRMHGISESPKLVDLNVWWWIVGPTCCERAQERMLQVLSQCSGAMLEGSLPSS